MMFFGMCNSPATFQSMMDAIFADMIDDNIVIIYMDDIFIYAPDEETLAKNTRRVLERLICSWNQQNASLTSQKLNI